MVQNLIPSPAYDLEVKVTDLEKFMLKFCVKVFKNVLFTVSTKVRVELLHYLRRGVGVGVGVNKNVEVYIKVFKTFYFLNPQTGLVYFWYDCRCWSKILLSTIHTPACDLDSFS